MLEENNLDKITERDRYDSRSSKALSGENNFIAAFGAGSVEKIFEAPYLLYEKHIAEIIRPGNTVLEIGSGSGLHTRSLLLTGAEITASDISPNSLSLLEKGLRPLFGDRLKTQVADMEALPFENSSFDVVTSAGSLSYGDPVLVNNEIIRVLKPNGVFICVDSLNHNPVYRMNRYVQFLRGQRSRSTLVNMPDMRRIESFRSLFNSLEVNFFGSLTWAAPLLTRLMGNEKAINFINSFDRIVRVKRSAFKFVLVGKRS